MMAYRKSIALLLFLTLPFFTTLNLSAQGKASQKDLEKQIEELERENKRLRELIDFQMKEILRYKEQEKQWGFEERTDMESDVTLYDEYTDDKWRFSFGGAYFWTFDMYDHLTDPDSSPDKNGSYYGIKGSFGKSKTRLSFSGYIGDYAFRADKTEPSGDYFKSKITSNRVDVDVALMHWVRQKKIRQFGWLLGLKYLYAGKEGEFLERSDTAFDSKKLTGKNNWYMATPGFFLSHNLTQKAPLSFFGSFNILFGYVEGVTEESEETNIWDQKIDRTWINDSSLAYGANGTFGIQYVINDIVAMQLGYRGQILNSIDDFMVGAKFYEGHQSVFMALQGHF